METKTPILETIPANAYASETVITPDADRAYRMGQAEAARLLGRGIKAECLGVVAEVVTTLARQIDCGKITGTDATTRTEYRYIIRED